MMSLEGGRERGKRKYKQERVKDYIGGGGKSKPHVMAQACNLSSSQGTIKQEGHQFKTCQGDKTLYQNKK